MEVVGDAWVRCSGPPPEGTRLTTCGNKLAKSLPDGKFEIMAKDQRARLHYTYICSGVSVIICASCGTPCVLICNQE